ncbi:MAG: hypothetical protein LUE29_12215 [Lachnospiraceae bacterium]|nr:hypothetical protein [Lachnospiraceae bacterium]
MKKTVREIARRKNLPANLPRYTEGMMGRYLEFSAVRLALNYHVFCDMQRDRAGKAEACDDVLSRFYDAMERIPGILETETVRPEEIGLLQADVESLRGIVTDRMQVLTSYTDIFHLYEYVLNRVEYRFREGGLPENYSDEAFCREIMKYIVRDEEAAEVNRKIGEILGQLPIRLTKQKFFELLDAGLSTYMGTDRSGFDDFLYMIRMSAMLEEPQTVSGEFAHLNLAKEEFRVCDYANITEEEYRHLAGRMKEISDDLNETSEQYTLLMEQLNDIYVILKSCGAKTQADAEVLKACENIIRSSKDPAYASDDSDAKDETPESDLREDMLDRLVSLEGVQESISEELNTYGYLVTDLYDGDQDALKSLGFLETFHDLKDMENLTSSSIFVNLDAKDAGEIAVDEDYIAQKKEILHRDIENLFSVNSRLVRRAVMATVISQLPVFFENLNAMQDFVYSSLAQCRDEAEKIACVEVISSILTES